MVSMPSESAEWASLPPDLIGRCLELLNPNDMAFHGRLVNKDASGRFSDPLHRTATFSIPLPEAATKQGWQQYMLQAFQQLTFVQKFMSISVAAGSGSQRNLELAWALLQPCVSLGYVHAYIAEDAGTAAVRFGQLHLLPWLLQHDCPMDKHRVLEAAAQHCDMQQLLHVWGLLGCDAGPPSGDRIHARLARAAVSSGSDVVAKLSWLLAVFNHLFQYSKRTEREMVVGAAKGVAESSNLPVLRWLLHERDPTLCSNTLAELWEEDENRPAKWPTVLSSALCHGHMAMAEWLVDEAGCPVLQRGQQGAQQGGQQVGQQEQEAPWELRQLWYWAARGGSVEAMRWLLRRGVRVCGKAMPAAAKSGCLEAVRFLHEECGGDAAAGQRFLVCGGLGQRAACHVAAAGGLPHGQGRVRRCGAFSPRAHAAVAVGGGEVPLGGGHAARGHDLLVFGLGCPTGWPWQEQQQQ